MAINKHINEYDARQFTWNGKHGVAELSSFGREPVSRIYDDAMDVGFYVSSQKSGKRVLFYLVSEVKDACGEQESDRTSGIRVILGAGRFNQGIKGAPAGGGVCGAFLAVLGRLRS